MKHEDEVIVLLEKMIYVYNPNNQMANKEHPESLKSAWAIEFQDSLDYTLRLSPKYIN